MKQPALFVLIALSILSTVLFAQSGFLPYHARTDFALAPPGALRFGLYGFENPALLSHLHQPDALFTWSDKSGKWSDFNNWGLFVAVPHLGFGVAKEKTAGGTVTDYQLSLGAGHELFSFGVAYGWSGGDVTRFGRTDIFKIGALLRPNTYLSFGLSGTTSVSGKGEEAVFDLAARPFRTEVATFFADYTISDRVSIKNGPWSIGAAVEALPGIRIAGRYFDTKAFTLGIEIALGRAAVSTLAHFDRDRNHSYTTYGLRLGAYDRTFLSRLTPRQKYVELNLFGPLKYRRFVLFDNSKTLSGILMAIDAAKVDGRVAAIAINTSGMEANREMLWEIREKLKDFKTSGKNVVVFIDRPGIDEYHLASVADKIVLDPTGLIVLPGFVTGRTFLKGTLEKVGIGYDEWRFFKYKSAVEVFSRDKMSEGDREQRQKLVDDFYRLAKKDICEGRRISEGQFDQWVNEDALFLPHDAIEKGLADTLGRWEEVRAMVETLQGTKKTSMGAGALARFNLPDDNVWGGKPRIAVIYALGVCAMDEGITARRLVKDVDAASDDNRIKAIVLRVDSPGGDAIASDYIAEALKKARAKKPVIVSQGLVAASGGYWLSMYADTIVAAPNTITGSIGVIGGWFYNAGLKEYLGMTTDFAKSGRHADLGFGFTLPFIGASLPDRNLNAEERAKMERGIKSMYGDFVQKVAAGRASESEKIEPIAQGRIWSGYDGRENGLVDVLGGLETAINIAKTRAGIPADQEIHIVESPEPALFDFSALAPRILGIDAPVREDAFIEHLRFRLKQNGLPTPIMPLEDIDFARDIP
jgi:protease-4